MVTYKRCEVFALEAATALHLVEHIQIEQLDVHSLHAFQLFLLQSQKNYAPLSDWKRGKVCYYDEKITSMEMVGVYCFEGSREEKIALLC